jgi:hypothetical protein
MATNETIENYFEETGLTWESIADHTWMIHDEYDTIDNIVVYLNDPVVYFRVKLMDIPKNCNRQQLFETLLKLNTADMLHGAYGLEGDSVVATDTLQADNLDLNEFQASIDSLSLCITSHYKQLAQFHGQQIPAELQ